MVQTVLDSFFKLVAKKTEIQEEISLEKEKILTEYEDGAYFLGKDEGKFLYMLIGTERKIKFKKFKKEQEAIDGNKIQTSPGII